MPKEVYGRDFQFLERSQLLNFDEIHRLVGVFRRFGIEKVRITGGEPLVRRQLEKLIGMLAQEPDLDLTLTTNGSLLRQKAQALTWQYLELRSLLHPLIAEGHLVGARRRSGIDGEPDRHPSALARRHRLPQGQPPSSARGEFGEFRVAQAERADQPGLLGLVHELEHADEIVRGAAQDHPRDIPVRARSSRDCSRHSSTPARPPQLQQGSQSTSQRSNALGT